MSLLIRDCSPGRVPTTTMEPQFEGNESYQAALGMKLSLCCLLQHNTRIKQRFRVAWPITPVNSRHIRRSSVHHESRAQAMRRLNLRLQWLVNWSFSKIMITWSTFWNVDE